MRYYPIDQIKSGMVLGQEIHDASGRMLIAKYAKLNDENISFIAFLGIPGIYIDDQFTKDVEIREVVRPEVRKSAIQIVQDIFKAAIGGDLSSEESAIQKNVKDIVDNVLENEDVMYNMVELKTHDDYTYFHSANVAILACVLGAKSGLSQQQLDHLVMAGFLHDIGKVFINPEIITAPRRLTEEERIEMMDHPRLGYEFLVKNYDFPKDVTDAVYEHHEWHNGGGYPRRLKGKEILELARILKLADVYDAMTSRRSYHEPYLPSDVLEYIMARSGMEFDPPSVQVMANELSVYPVGVEVELSNGRHGIVVENHRGFVLRPTLKMLDDGKYLNLLEDRSALRLTITKLMMCAIMRMEKPNDKERTHR